MEYFFVVEILGSKFKAERTGLETPRLEETIRISKYEFTVNRVIRSHIVGEQGLQTDFVDVELRPDFYGGDPTYHDFIKELGSLHFKKVA